MVEGCKLTAHYRQPHLPIDYRYFTAQFFTVYLQNKCSANWLLKNHNSSYDMPSMKPESGATFQYTEFLEFLGYQALVISHQSKECLHWNASFCATSRKYQLVRSGHLYHNDLQISKSQWGGLWEVKIFSFTVFWQSRTCSIVDRRICDYKHHAEAPDDTSWKSRCKAGLLLLGRHMMTIIYFKP